ncbi:metallophosphoesterase family protein [Roseibium sp. M-1]
MIFMTSFIQISDSHLGLPGTEKYWEVAMDIIARRRPDLVLHTGDISENGYKSELEKARMDLDRLGVLWRALPGNHDIGDGPPVGPGPDQARVELFESVVGPSRFSLSIGGWTFIGISGLEFGLENEAERQGWQWLETSLRSAEQAVAVVLHKPVFIDWAAERRDTSAAIPYCARKRLWRLIETRSVGLVLSGHRHTYRLTHHGGVPAIWGPAIADLPELTPPFVQVDCRPAIVEYRLTAGGFQHQLIYLEDSGR